MVAKVVTVRFQVAYSLLTVTGFLLNEKVEIKRAENLFLIVNQHFIFY